MAVVYRWVPRGVARMAGEHPLMDLVAAELAAEWKAASVAIGVDTGAYSGGIHVERRRRYGVSDRLVVRENSPGEGADAISIEFGHYDSRTGRYYPGQHVARGVAG